MMPKHLYLDHDLSSEIERLAATPGTAQFMIAHEALRKFFKHRRSGEHEAAIGTTVSILAMGFAIYQASRARSYSNQIKIDVEKSLLCPW